MSPPANARERFSSRVADYVRHRPSYPPEAFEAIRRLTDGAVDRTIVDVGSGTGISAAWVLHHSATARILGVEPNDAMRAAAEAVLAGEARFRYVAVNHRNISLQPPDETQLFVGRL